MSAHDDVPADEGGDAACWAHLLDEASAPSDATLAALVHDLTDAVIIADRAGTVVLWNRAAERLFGWPANEAIGTSLDLIIPSRLRARHWDGYRRVMAGGTPEYADRLLEVPALHRDGRTLSIAFTVTLLADADDALTGVAAVVRDDTERWQERRALRAELASLRGPDDVQAERR